MTWDAVNIAIKSLGERKQMPVAKLRQRIREEREQKGVTIGIKLQHVNLNEVLGFTSLKGTVKN